MRVYRKKSIIGYSLGVFPSPYWSWKPSMPGVLMVPCVRGIDEDLQEAYFRYLLRVGEHTFGLDPTYAPQPYGPPVSKVYEFATMHLYMLWPTYGRFWQAAGAYIPFFEQSPVPHPYNYDHVGAVGRAWWEWDLFLRYQEGIWEGRLVSVQEDGRIQIVQGPWLGEILMFDRRGRGIEKGRDDSWDFGMAWVETAEVLGGMEVYLWETAEVTYLGMATRKSRFDLITPIYRPGIQQY